MGLAISLKSWFLFFIFVFKVWKYSSFNNLCITSLNSTISPLLSKGFLVVWESISMSFAYGLRALKQWFFLWQIFAILQKKRFCCKFPVILRKIGQETQFLLKIFQNCHNWLQFERVLKIFYFDTLSTVKSGKINLRMISIWVTSRNWEKKNTGLDGTNRAKETNSLS